MLSLSPHRFAASLLEQRRCGSVAQVGREGVFLEANWQQHFWDEWQSSPAANQRGLSIQVSSFRWGLPTEGRMEPRMMRHQEKNAMRVWAGREPLTSTLPQYCARATMPTPDTEVLLKGLPRYGAKHRLRDKSSRSSLSHSLVQYWGSIDLLLGCVGETIKRQMGEKREREASSRRRKAEEGDPELQESWNPNLVCIEVTPGKEKSPPGTNVELPALSFKGSASHRPSCSTELIKCSSLSSPH